MADDHGKKGDEKPKDEKKDEKKKDHGIQIDQSVVDWMTHRIMEGIVGSVLPWGADKVGEMITGRVTKANDKPKHFVSFGEALIKLKEVDEHSYDVIRDFMLVSLTNDVDRDDFQVRTAQMGGKEVMVTVAFLQLVATEPDHQSRKDFLEAMGLIGERAIDPIERAKLVATKVAEFSKTRGLQAWTWIKNDIDASFQVLTATAAADNVRLQAELDRRRALRTPAAPAAPTGNRFARAWNALRGR